MRAELKKYRLEKKLSVSQIASIFKISSSFYYKIESGIRNPNIKLAKDIADYFGKDMKELFFDK
ncbi:helix-turn-helix transcriptional regulator [Wukongibacter sp. M2B1]|uniref:helix-turn-helix transcriptional regulator n=1 Tax=Wukongibacter sp. M2B1 TaxID=3088895 RepID=UPI003D7BFD7A